MKWFLSIFIFGSCFLGWSQLTEIPKKYNIGVSPFYGSIIRHNPDITHLITSHPGGVIIDYNRKRYGAEEWEALYGYPDTGYTFIYQNMNNPTLGEHFGVYAHYNFYFLRRQLQLRIGQGIAYNTNPYDKVTNFRNSSYGSSFLSSTMLMFNYHKENIVEGLGVKTGIALVHYSNANFKAPNASTNTFAFNFGFVYDLDGGKEIEYIKPKIQEKITEPFRFNFVLRFGTNEGDVVGSGQYGFITPTFYVDKRLGRKSAIQLGADMFFSTFLIEYIKFRSVAFPEENVAAGTDWKRGGIFIGHELFINKLSIITQMGYYVYYPFEYEMRVYNRTGLKRYFGDKMFATVTLHSHAAAAEAVEFGIGIRL